MSKHAAATTIQARVRGRQARQRATGFNKPTLTWAVKEVVAAAETVVSVVDRERLCCDILNTSVMGALVGDLLSVTCNRILARLCWKM